MHQAYLCEFQIKKFGTEDKNGGGRNADDSFWRYKYRKLNQFYACFYLKFYQFHMFFQILFESACFAMTIVLNSYEEED